MQWLIGPIRDCISVELTITYTFFMSTWEHKYLIDGTNCFFLSIQWYGHYIDDLLFMAMINVIKPIFQHFLNHNSMKMMFTVSADKYSVIFGFGLHLYFWKLISGNNILHEESCHPPHTVNSIPLCEMTRVGTNCSSLIFSMNHAVSLIDWAVENIHSGH